ncbi:ras guanine nucleotide exchange factor domain-containing protein [Phlebopus sp. FC_14]|nr:ras guanine nucleotide exchange factor domain-containing protein [Phlebopus sp. FC_14]
MPPSRLHINTDVHRDRVAAPKRSAGAIKAKSPNPQSQNISNGITRMRSGSTASTSSSISVDSPGPSSSASSSSLHLPDSGKDSAQPTHHALSTPVSPSADETVRVAAAPEFVLALHDFFPQQQNATCLSFRAGQVIHVLNRDASGWWDGEINGQRGWFPSNYVSADEGVISLTEEELPHSSRPIHRHGHSMSAVSATSWASTPSRGSSRKDHRPLVTEALGADITSYCPPLMVNLLHSLSLLQSAVRSNRIAHFQPSTACIISCVRFILSSTECLPREAPLLRRFPPIAFERKQILSVLAALVSQAKKASDETCDEEARDAEVERMLKLGGQVFSQVRRFLAVAVQCGVELPEKGQPPDTSDEASSANERLQWQGSPNPTGTTPTPPELANISHFSSRFVTPTKPVLARTKKEHYLLYERATSNRHKSGMMSISSTSSSSSFSSTDSPRPMSVPVFPSGPSTSTEVLEALNYTHDQYLSTIAAFIGHAHSHARSSHASSTGHMYDLVREIVELVCKLLTIVEAAMRHQDIPSHERDVLKLAKEGLYNVTSSLAESVRLLTVPLPPDITEESERSSLIRSATAACKAGADCVSAVKSCLDRVPSEQQFIIQVPTTSDSDSPPFTPSKFSRRSGSVSTLRSVYSTGVDGEDTTIHVQTPSTRAHKVLAKIQETSSDSSDATSHSKSSVTSQDTALTSPDEGSLPSGHESSHCAVDNVERLLPCAQVTSNSPAADAAKRDTREVETLEDGPVHNDALLVTLDVKRDPLGHDHSVEDVIYNNDGHLVAASLEVLVEKMIPHDSIVDPAFSAVFFLTFRLFASPMDLVQALINRYNVMPPATMSEEDMLMWQQYKGIPIRLRVSNFVKTWLETYWRSSVDDAALPHLASFARDALQHYFPGPSQRILDLISMRQDVNTCLISPKSERVRDPGMSINPPSFSPSEIPRPTMTKTLLAALRSRSFESVTVTDFDALELARQLTIMECELYCAIQPEEVLETGQESVKPPINVRAVSSLSTVITGWIAENILNEHDMKKRTQLVKFFIKVADRCTSLQNFSTPRSILAALDSSTISRLHQTWLGVPQKNKMQLEALRRLADHSRNYHEYRNRLRNTAPPAVPFLGLYLTDVTFCREGNPSYRDSPLVPGKKLLNFNKYHKLARIVQDMQRFQVSYNLKKIPEVHEYLSVAFENSKHHGDLQDLYRRSLLVEPKQPADTPPTSDMRHLFNWATRSQAQQPTSA